jgi:hypothetical protein
VFAFQEISPAKFFVFLWFETDVALMVICSHHHTNSIEEILFSEADSRSANEDILLPFMEPEDTVPCSQEHAT